LLSQLIHCHDEIRFGPFHILRLNGNIAENTIWLFLGFPANQSKQFHYSRMQVYAAALSHEPDWFNYWLGHHWIAGAFLVWLSEGI